MRKVKGVDKTEELYFFFIAYRRNKPFDFFVNRIKLFFIFPFRQRMACN